MKYLKSFEKLDEVLNYAYDHQYRAITINELISYLQLSYSDMFSTGNIKSILSMLVKGRHMNVSAPDSYRITLEGRVFVENGGYMRQRGENYAKRQYMRVARRYGDETSVSTPSWLLALIGFALVCLLSYYVYYHFNWRF